MYGNSGSSSCTGDSCRLAGIIVGSVIGGIFGLVLLVVGVCCCHKRFRGKPLRSNSMFVTKTFAKSNKLDMHEMNHFQSGFWTSGYFQYKRWHGSNQLSLSFDAQELKVSGSGTDDIGTYSIVGTYSTKTRRMGLSKTYQQGTGNPLENLGHTVTIQLEWNSNREQFEGKWYVLTKKFHGEDKFELKFNREHVTE